jgi:glycine/sarcosine N-methyltransferase
MLWTYEAAMNLYDRLAPYYDDFFPQDPKATSFLLGLAGRTPTESGGAPRGAATKPIAVDFGCATGSQVLDLARSGWRAIGWEPCEAMLEIARRKASDREIEASFEPYAMQEAAARIGQKSVGLALCLGNTLPHLGGEDELDSFVEALALIVAPGGAVALQLLNYDLVLPLLREGKFGFPVLRAAGAAFERSYSMGPDGRILFSTGLEYGGNRYAESGRLIPFSRNAIASRLEAALFEGIESRSAWDDPSFDPAEDRYLIMTARRP